MLRISDYDEKTDTTLWVWYSATESAAVLSRYAYSNVQPEQHLNTGPAAKQGVPRQTLQHSIRQKPKIRVS